MYIIIIIFIDVKSYLRLALWKLTSIKKWFSKTWYVLFALYIFRVLISVLVVWFRSEVFKSIHFLDAPVFTIVL